jgi:hypothetical protein
MNRNVSYVIAAGLAFAAAPAGAQSFATENPVLRRIWEEGTRNSQLERLGQALSDSIGPRLTASPGIRAGNQWLIDTYRSWGISARNEQYGTFRGWRRGYSHADLVQPRVRSLEGTMLAWSPGTNGPVTAPVVALPDFADQAAFEAWLPSIRGKLVAISMPQPTCRPDDNWKQFATESSFARMKDARTAATAAWTARIQRTGVAARDLAPRLEQAGAAGVLTSLWSGGWGVDRIFNARTHQVPTFDLSCEDYGLVYRLAEHHQGPVVRIDAQSEELGELPVFNTIAEIRGSQKPNEYIVLSAHFDSWDGSSGSTDNGTGTITMMEALRILRTVYPNPKRTIVVGHWSGEEQGLNGSRGYVKDHPEVVNGLQALFNQDNGTGRVTSISMQGLTGAAGFMGKWLALVPSEIGKQITLDNPGVPSTGGSDYASFICAGAPAFGLSSLSWDYGAYTWHTTRDTYDKIVWDDVRNNAVLTAMLVYLASEEPQRVPRDRRTVFPTNTQTGQPFSWPACTDAARTTSQSTRM